MSNTDGFNIWLPMTSPLLTDQFPPVVVERGEGVYIWDDAGNRYLDFQGGLWNVNVGYSRIEVIEAMQEQLQKIAYYSSFANFTNGPSIALSRKLLQLLAPENMHRVLFTSGGSDSNETAMKLSRQYWKLMGQPERTKFISLKGAYHGLHFGTMSLTGGIWGRAYEPLLPGCYQIDSPSIYRNPWTDDPEELGSIIAGILDRQIQTLGPDTVAALFAEPVQGAGSGCVVPPDNMWPLLREVCDKHGVLLVADEVITGFGRTGKLFGVRNWGVKPDIMCFAKGINSAYVPLGATVVNERVAAAWDNAADNPMGFIMHGYTYSGHALACASALAAIKIVEDEDLPGNAATVGSYFQERLHELDKYPSVGEIRGRGLMQAIDLVVDKKTREPVSPKSGFAAQIAKICKREGFIIRGLSNLLIFSPPLTIDKQHVDDLMPILDMAFSEVHG